MKKRKAWIRSKGTNTDGTKRFVLEFIKDRSLRSIALNPDKLVELLDCPNTEDVSKEKWTKKNSELSNPLVYEEKV